MQTNTQNKKKNITKIVINSKPTFVFYVLERLESCSERRIIIYLHTHTHTHNVNRQIFDVAKPEINEPTEFIYGFLVKGIRPSAVIELVSFITVFVLFV